MTVDFPALAASLLAEAPTLLRQWLPLGTQRGREFRIGNVQGDAGESLSVNIDTGAWADFSGPHKGGDLVSLYAAIHGLKQGEAAKRLSDGHEEKPEDTYVTGYACHPIPRHKHGKPSYIWEYKDAEDKTLGYVCRFDPLNESKQFAPLTAWRTHDGQLKWKWKKWPGNAPLYQADKIAANPVAKVLLVEGEKTADAAQKLLPDWVVTTWPGGAGAVKQADYSALKFRYCWVWPDADEPGAKAAKQLKAILPDLHIVALPDDLSPAWDLGDAPADFDVLKHLQDKPKALAVKVDDVPARTKDQQTQLHFTHYNPHNTNKLLATLANTRDLLRYYKIICRYNVISKRILHIIPGESFSSENEEEAALACIYSYMKEWQLPVDGHKLYLTRIADENQFNPVMEWINSKPWDGISRLPDLYNTIESPETEAKELLIRRWLITAVCMARGEGVDSAGCLVLQGGQDMGKTWWVRRLVPESLYKSLIRTDASVDPHDKDSVSQIISYWIVELGEIDATFKRADLQALKSFITRDTDIMRRPYGEGDKRYPRRTALIASVDQLIYLYDSAGNRRFWTIPCTSINSYHAIDMQQLWAEVLDLIENHGETWKLAPDEKAHIKRINEEHMQIEPIHELINTKYFSEDSTRIVKEWLTATQVARGIDLKTISQRETRIVTSYLRARDVIQKRIGNGLMFHL